MATLPSLDPATTIASADEIIVRKDGEATDKRSTFSTVLTWLQSILSTNDFNSFTKEISATTYTLIDADSGGFLRFTNASGCTLTVPNGLKSGFYVGVGQWGAGAVTLLASGTTIRNSESHTQTNALYGMAVIQVVDTDEYGFQGATI